ncbi:hypothetical protein AB1E84_002245 [Yersinia enterocolitica]|uniref:hypothetical protein n=1 Tax=Yersinia TaxID=629 RepID=UPI0016437E5A|nr:MULTISPECIES: hypothetical protein [Yersinia]MDN0104115.1 hypothetical protein [Yersinia bercovieri]
MITFIISTVLLVVFIFLLVLVIIRGHFATKSNHWLNLIDDIKELFSRLAQPKFVLISFVTLSVSTCGIWIGPLFLGDTTQLGFSIFSFIIATLGVLAAENLLRDEGELTNTQFKYRKQVKMSFSVFLWFISFVFSFYGLKGNVNSLLVIAFIITLVLWLSISSTKSDFDFPGSPERKMREELEIVNNSPEPGDGL